MGEDRQGVLKTAELSNHRCALPWTSKNGWITVSDTTHRNQRAGESPVQAASQFANAGVEIVGRRIMVASMPAAIAILSTGGESPTVSPRLLGRPLPRRKSCTNLVSCEHPAINDATLWRPNASAHSMIVGGPWRCNRGRTELQKHRLTRCRERPARKRDLPSERVVREQQTGEGRIDR